MRVKLVDFAEPMELGKPDRKPGIGTLALLPLYRAQERRPCLHPDHRQEPLLSLLHHRTRGQRLFHSRGNIQLKTA